MNTLILEEKDGNEFYTDIYQKLADSRVLFISQVIDGKIASDICANLLLKDQENSNEKITLILNSPGGYLRDVFSIYDVMQIINCPVETICLGQLTSSVVLLLAAGTKGLRKISPNSTLVVEELELDKMFQGDLKNIKMFHNQFKYDIKKYTEALAKATGKNFKTMSSYLLGKKYLSAAEAKSNGFVDMVVK